MLLTPDCIICNCKASLSAIRQLTSDENTIRELTSEIFRIPAMRGLEWNITSPEVFEIISEKILAVFGDPDPFRALKDEQNRKGLELYPWLTDLVSEAEDALSMAVNLAVIGNSLDVMWSGGSVEIEPVINEKLKNPVPRDHYLEFKRSLKESKFLVYFGDNSGEVIFDKLLIQTMKQVVDVDVVFVVRSLPTLNDVTLREAKIVGMDETARIVENGMNRPLPGTIPSRCSEELRTLVEQADMVISKGGGNFDTLDEEENLPYNTFFMLMCKCVPYHELFGTDLYHPILRRGGRRASGQSPQDRRKIS